MAMRRSPASRPALLVALALTMSCHGPRFETGDLEAMRRAGELRVAVRPGFMTSPVHGADGIDQPRLLRQLASRLDLRLRWLQAGWNDQVLRWLGEGRADIGVFRFSPAGLHRAGYLPSAAVTWVDDLVIAGKGSPVHDMSGLRGTTVHVPFATTDWVLPTGDLLWKAGAVRLPVPGDVSLETIVARVRGGRYAASVTDSALLAAVGGAGVRIVGHLSDGRSLVWALRKGNPRLREAVDGFLFAEQVLGMRADQRACRDLAEIRDARTLRVITTNAPTTITVFRGGLRGFEYELSMAFARSLGVRLQLVIPPKGEDPLQALAGGLGDLAALHEPLPLAAGGRYLATEPYGAVDLVSVAGPGVDPPAGPEDLAGRRVLLPPSFFGWVAEVPVGPPVGLVALPAGADSLSVLAALERGGAELGVVDADTLDLELSNRPSLRRGPVVVPGCALRWAVGPASTELRRRASHFLSDARRSGLIRRLELEELERIRRWRPPKSVPVPPGHLSPFDELLQDAGRRYKVDWRLLASLMYEESRFDPNATGPGGSAGLFQFMPFTWKELGVGDPRDPRQAVPAGARYLRRLMDEFREVPMADRVAMAVASYNVGPRHVADARRLAREMGLDPGRWAGNVETAMVLLDNPDVARRFPAGVCRCRRAVGYTRRILRRYRAYRELMTPVGAPGL